MTGKAWVVLHHTGAPGGDHYDWLFDIAEAPAGPLVAFRVAVTPNEALAAAPVVAERIKDHRRVYLDFEGELTGGRGAVARVGRGGVVSCEWDGRTLRAELTWDGAAVSLSGEAADGGVWSLRLVRAPA